MSFILLSTVGALFGVLLAIMIVIVALFGFIIFIALRPTEYDKYKNESTAEYALSKKETELTMSLLQLLNKESDATKRAELEAKLREVKAAQALVSSLTEGDKDGEGQPAAKPVQKPAAAKPAAEKPTSKPAATTANANANAKANTNAPANANAKTNTPVEKPTSTTKPVSGDKK